MKKIFPGQNLCSGAFGGNNRPYTKQRARHGSPFLEPPPSFAGRPCHPPHPPAKQFSGRPAMVRRTHAQHAQDLVPQRGVHAVRKDGLVRGVLRHVDGAGDDHQDHEVLERLGLDERARRAHDAAVRREDQQVGRGEAAGLRDPGLGEHLHEPVVAPLGVAQGAALGGEPGLCGGAVVDGGQAHDVALGEEEVVHEDADGQAEHHDDDEEVEGEEVQAGEPVHLSTRKAGWPWASVMCIVPPPVGKAPPPKEC